MDMWLEYLFFCKIFRASFLSVWKSEVGGSPKNARISARNGICDLRFAICDFHLLYRYDVMKTPTTDDGTDQRFTKEASISMSKLLPTVQ